MKIRKESRIERMEAESETGRRKKRMMEVTQENTILKPYFEFLIQLSL